MTKHRIGNWWFAAIFKEFPPLAVSISFGYLLFFDILHDFFAHRYERVNASALLCGKTGRVTRSRAGYTLIFN